MPTYYARKAGNINAADVWATTPSGTASAVTFASGDVLMANSFAITVNVSTNLGSTGQVRTDTTGGATAGGTFTLSDGITLTGNLFGFASGVGCVTFSAAAPATAYIVGNIYGGTVSSSFGARNIGTGTLNITGNIFGSNVSTGGGAVAVVLTGDGVLNVSGNVLAGNNTSYGIQNSSVSGVVIVTGIVTGGSSSAAYGLNLTSTGSATIAFANGGVSGAGVNNASLGQINITRAKGNAYGPGNTAVLGPAVGAANSGLGVIEIEQLEYGLYGMSPTSGTGIRLKKITNNIAKFNYCDTAGAKTLVDATQGQMPAATDVRSGVSYASGALSGSCAVPAASSVAFGVPVDATTGTAILTGAAVASAVWGAASRTITGGVVDTLTNAPASVTPSDIWSHATRTITGGTVDTLTNAPSVPSASAIASQVRTELSPELAKVSALNTTRLAQVSTTEIVGNLLAQANS